MERIYSAMTDVSIKDPRPDLKEDSCNWDVLLLIAYFEDKNTSEGFVNILRGFRQAGCRLYTGKTIQEGMIFNFGTEVDEDQKIKLIKVGKANKERLKMLFMKTYMSIQRGKDKTDVQ